MYCEQKGRNPSTPRHRSNRKLHKPPICDASPPPRKTSPKPPEGVQRRWDPQQERGNPILHRPGSTHRRKEDEHEVLPHGIGPPKNDPRVPLVRRSPTENRLGQRVDRLRPTTRGPENTERPPNNLLPMYKSPSETEKSTHQNTTHNADKPPTTNGTTPNERRNNTSTRILKAHSGVQ
jgi:hypothetical protein